MLPGLEIGQDTKCFRSRLASTDSRLDQMQVQEIWRFPVKSFQGERVSSAEIAVEGIVGDRAWCLFDRESGFHLTARREPVLLFASAQLAGSGTSREVIISLPNGREVISSTNECDDQLSDWIGRPVQLRRAAADIAGTFESQADESDTGRWSTWTGTTGSFHDTAGSNVSLVSLDAFGRWDPRRFRLNVVLTSDPGVDSETTEDGALIGRRITLGSVRLDVMQHVERCVMTTRPQPPLDTEPAIERDLNVFRTIASELGGVLGLGATVSHPGRITVGDRLLTDD